MLIFISSNHSNFSLSATITNNDSPQLSCFVLLGSISSRPNSMPSDNMFSNIRLETAFGELNFAIFRFSPWTITYNSILWIAVVLSNAVSLTYIIKKLNTSNLINQIAILECLVNIVGFVLIGIVSLLAVFDPSKNYFSCQASYSTLLTLWFTGINAF